MFKAMTWNVENLFRSGAPSGPRSDDVYKAKLEGLAATIDAQAPDVVALQEVGDPEALGDLVAFLDGTWHQRLSAIPDRRHIRVAWLSRHPITASEDIDAFPPHLSPVQVDDMGGTEGSMARGALAVTVDVAGAEPVQLVTAHLKSKLLTFPNGRFQPTDENERARFGAYALYRRTAEATTLRAWATEALAGEGTMRPLMLMGDLNDTVDAGTTQLLLGPPGSELGTLGFDRPDEGDGQRLWNLAPRMPEGRDYSRINRGRKELIDHILVSAALVRRLRTVEAVIEEPDGRPLPLPSITGNPTERRDDPSSDHAPVVATFEL